jgi:hypothetical protein
MLAGNVVYVNFANAFEKGSHVGVFDISANRNVQAIQQDLRLGFSFDFQLLRGQ